MFITNFIDEVASLAAEAEKKKAEERTEQEKLAILGRPRLGDITRAQIRIKESKEFKVRNVFVIVLLSIENVIKYKIIFDYTLHQSLFKKYKGIWQ